METARPLGVFYAFRDSRERRAALSQPLGALERYRLFGLDEIRQRGVRVSHNLERGRPQVWARAADRTLNALLYRAGGYGGDFASILASIRQVNRADVVLSTVDTVGLPLVLLRRAGLVRPPIVYVAVGLPERLVQLRWKRVRALYASALCGTHTIVAYSQHEAECLREWLAPDVPNILFVPFGVDVDAFRPADERAPDVDVVAVGADPRRDFELLRIVALRRPELSFRIVASRDQARSLGSLPANVALETDIPLEQVKERLTHARVVALPVRENSYSGATTVLLQAMAMAKPVVVSRTQAIAEGYALENGVNCRLVEPGDGEALERAIVDLVTDAGAASALGTRARETVVRRLSWKRYTDALAEAIFVAAGVRG